MTTGATIQVRCPDCGDMTLSASQVTIHAFNSIVTWTCLCCGRRMAQQLDPVHEDQLLDVGVAVVAS